MNLRKKRLESKLSRKPSLLSLLNTKETIEQIFLDMYCWMIDINITRGSFFYGHKWGKERKEKLNESLNRFKLDSTCFQQAFNIFYVFNNVGRPFQTHRTFGSKKCWMQVEANVETVCVTSCNEYTWPPVFLST